MMRIKLFCGYDERESAGYHTFCHSVMKRSTEFVQYIPLGAQGMKQGTNEFTFSRFLVPALCGFKGHAIFADASDMLCLGDIAELDALFDPKYAVQCVKHPDYQSQHARKYIGTPMECSQSNYSKKNWASLMIVNAEHSAWFGMTQKAIGMMSPMQLLQFQNLMAGEIGDLPPEWNVLVDEGQPTQGAKLLHFTNGIPSFAHYKNLRGSAEWFEEFDNMTNKKAAA